MHQALALGCSGGSSPWRPIRLNGPKQPPSIHHQATLWIPSTGAINLGLVTSWQAFIQTTNKTGTLLRDYYVGGQTLIWLQLCSYHPNKWGCTPPLPEIKNSNPVWSKWDYSAKLAVTKEEVGCECWKKICISLSSAMLVNMIYTGNYVVVFSWPYYHAVSFNLHNTRGLNYLKDGCNIYRIKMTFLFLKD